MAAQTGIAMPVMYVVWFAISLLLMLPTIGFLLHLVIFALRMSSLSALIRLHIVFWFFSTLAGIWFALINITYALTAGSCDMLATTRRTMDGGRFAPISDQKHSLMLLEGTNLAINLGAHGTTMSLQFVLIDRICVLGRRIAYTTNMQHRLFKVALVCTFGWCTFILITSVMLAKRYTGVTCKAAGCEQRRAFDCVFSEVAACATIVCEQPELHRFTAAARYFVTIFNSICAAIFMAMLYARNRRFRANNIKHHHLHRVCRWRLKAQVGVCKLQNHLIALMTALSEILLSFIPLSFELMCILASRVFASGRMSFMGNFSFSILRRQPSSVIILGQCTASTAPSRPRSIGAYFEDFASKRGASIRRVFLQTKILRSIIHLFLPHASRRIVSKSFKNDCLHTAGDLSGDERAIAYKVLCHLMFGPNTAKRLHYSFILAMFADSRRHTLCGRAIS